MSKRRYKNVKLRVETWKELRILQAELELPSLDSVIQYLITCCRGGK